MMNPMVGKMVPESSFSKTGMAFDPSPLMGCPSVVANPVLFSLRLNV
jgi:hypothetical protein